MNLNRLMIALAGVCLLLVVVLGSGIHDVPLLMVGIGSVIFSLRKNEESHLLVFALLSAFPIFTLSKWYEPSIINQATESRIEALRSELNVIDGAVNSFFSNNAAALEALKLLASSETGVTNEQYQSWLKQLLPSSRNNFLNIAFSRDLTIEYVYPENSVNLPVIGVHQRDIPVQGPLYSTVLEQQQPITMGPVMLVQGVLGIIYVMPIAGPESIIISAVLSLETLQTQLAQVLKESTALSVNIINGNQQLELFSQVPEQYTLTRINNYDDIQVSISVNAPLIGQTATRTQIISRLSTFLFWLLLTLLLNWQSNGIRLRDEQKKAIELNQEALLTAQRIGQMGSWQLKKNGYELSVPLQELVGIEQNLVSFDEIAQRLHPSDADKLIHLWKQLTTGEQISGILEHRILVHNQFRWFEHRIVVRDDSTTGILRDINGIKEREQQVTVLESFDSLTGASNRRYFQLLVEQHIALSHRNKSMIALAIVSIDKFRVINEQFGQDAGDQLLKMVSQRIRDVTRKSDLIARLSGDTFAVALVDIKHFNQASRAIDLLFDAIRQPYAMSPIIIPQFTVGVSLYPDDATDFDSLLQKAEQTLSSAKNQARGSCHFYSKQLTEKNQRRQVIMSKLPNALRQNDLYMMYQPRVNSANKGIVGIEALVRWQDRELGTISPGEFIPLAESTHLIIEIGEWVIANVFEFYSKHKTLISEQVVFSINLSAKQLEDKHLVSLLKSLLDRYQLDAHHFEFEVTEHSLAVESEVMLKNMKTLSQMGFYFALDDFGTGYSNLGILQSLPLHVLKIDMTFIRNIGNDQRSNALVNAIVEMSQILNLTTVAEGVETQQQVDYLTKIACDQLQGYHFYKPLSTAELIALMCPNDGQV